MEEGQAQSDGETMAAAAKELGYDITIAALEQVKAEAEELDAEDLNQVTGGYDGIGGSCFKEYHCVFTWHDEIEDEDGHNTFCIAVWHCFTAALHTDSEEKKMACWSDYKCIFVNEHEE